MTVEGAWSLRRRTDSRARKGKPVASTLPGVDNASQPIVKTNTRGHDRYLRSDTLNVTHWRLFAWDTEQYGVSLRPRLAQCGCHPAASGI